MHDPIKRDHRPLNHEPEKNVEYLKKEYWDRRFDVEEQYDWFKKFEDFSHLVKPHIKEDDSILVLGCGNSSLTFELYKLGFRDITSIDLSEVVIQRMQKKSEALGCHELKWEVADMLSLPYPASSFDIVLEKGTMDVLFVDSDSPWHPQAEVCERVHKLLAEVHRILRRDGKFISITFAQPHFRRPFFAAEEYSWNTDVTPFGETFHYFVYVLQKGQKQESAVISGPACETGKSMSHDHMDREDYLLRIDL